MKLFRGPGVLIINQTVSDKNAMTDELNRGEDTDGGNPGMLLSRHVNGDPAAFPEFLERFRKPVYTYLVRCGVGPATRDDLFQDIFLKIHASAGSYSPERPVGPWVFTIAANTVRSHFRKLRVRKIVFRDTDNEAESENPDGLEIAEANETAKWLETEIAKLPLGQREAIALCSRGTMDRKAAAETLGIPPNTLKTNLRRAKTALAKALMERKEILEQEVP